jgi:uncharacterized protein YbaR (Trm112 family)
MRCPNQHVKVVIENASGTEWYCEECKEVYPIDEMIWENADR